MFDIAASGLLSINTTGTDHLGVKHGTFTLALTGHIELLKVLKFDASFVVMVGGGTFTVDTPQGGVPVTLGAGEWGFQFKASLNFFGIVTVSGEGFLDSRGDFSISLDGQVQIGPDGFCIKGKFHFNVTALETEDQHTHIPYYIFDLTASARVEADVFGFTFGGIGISASFHAEGSGRTPVTLSVTVTIDLWLFSVSKTADFDLGYLELPKAIILAGPTNVNDPWSASTDGVLYLNMDTRNPYGADAKPNETFEVEQIGGDVAFLLAAF